MMERIDEKEFDLTVMSSFVKVITQNNTKIHNRGTRTQLQNIVLCSQPELNTQLIRTMLPKTCVKIRVHACMISFPRVTI